MPKHSSSTFRIRGSALVLDIFRRRRSRSVANLIGALAISMAASPGVASESTRYVDARNQYVTVDHVRLAYRSIGSRNDVPPLVLFQHFGGTMDSVAGMSRLAEHFIDALKLKTVDVLGFSIGGSLGQQLVVLAYSNVFSYGAICAFLAVPLCLLISRKTPKGGAAPPE